MCNQSFQITIIPGKTIKLTLVLFVFSFLHNAELYAADKQSKPPVATKLAYLVQNSIAAINHANITGNYAVFRDLSAPNMIAHSTPATLAEEYRPFRENGIDLSPLLMIRPKLSEKAKINSEGLLTIKGYYPSKPLRTLFNVKYRNIAGRWRLESMKLKLIEAKKFLISKKNKPKKRSVNSKKPERKKKQ